MIHRKGGVGFLIFIVLLLLIMAFVVVFIFVKGKPEPVQSSGGNLSLNLTYFNITVRANADEKVSYELKNFSNFSLFKGVIFPDTVEFYRGGIQDNTSVFLSAWSNESYWNESLCNVTAELTPCNVSLKRKAFDFVVSLNSSSLLIDANDSGVVQSPVLVCFTERSNVVNVLMSDVRHSNIIPSDFKKVVDICYFIDDDIGGLKVFDLEIHKNPFNDVEDYLFVTVCDYEKPWLSGIGCKSGAVKV